MKIELFVGDDGQIKKEPVKTLFVRKDPLGKEYLYEKETGRTVPFGTSKSNHLKRVK